MGPGLPARISPLIGWLCPMPPPNRISPMPDQDIYTPQAEQPRSDNGCLHCDGTGEIETDNNGPIGECPLCGGTGKRPHFQPLTEAKP